MWDWQAIRRQSVHDARLASIEMLEARWLLNGSAGPVSIGLSSSPLQYVEKEGAVPIDPTLTISDSSETALRSASVELLGYTADEDSLSASAENGINVSWNSSTGVLTLSGQADIAAYQSVLRSASYTNGSDDPTTLPRTAQVTVTDSQSASGSAFRSISITAVNDPPSVQTPAVQTTGAGEPVVFSAGAGNSIVITDVDANGAAEQVTLTANDGTLELADTAGLSFGTGIISGAATITMVGTLDAINAAIDGLTFTPSSPYANDASLEISVDDMGNSGIGGAQIVNAIVPIVVTGPPAPPLTVGASNPPSPPTVGAFPPPSASQPTASAPDAPQPPVTALRSVVPTREIAEASGAAPASIEVPGGLQSTAIDADHAVFVSRSIQSTRQLEHPAASLPASAWLMGIGFVSGTSVKSQVSVFGSRLISTNEKTLEIEANSSFSSRGYERSHSAFCKRADVSNRSSAALFQAAGLLPELDSLRREVVSDLRLRFWAGGASLMAAGASLAYFLWMARGGSLLTGLLSSIPAWDVIDPLPILDQVSNAAAALKQNEDRGFAEWVRDAAGN